MNYIDISWPISSEMTTYKDAKNVVIAATKQFERDNVRETSIAFNSHTGTHIDAPSHFLEYGESIEHVSLTKINGPCIVLDCTDINTVITADDLAKHAITSSIVLLKTKNSQRSDTAPFDSQFIYLDQSGAQYFVDNGVIAIGIDYLGIERNQPAHETHTTLLKAGIVIIEGLRLAQVTPRTYTLHCLPLHVVGSDGAPARAILTI